MNQLPIGLNVDALAEWEEYRADKGKPLSRLARVKVINRLAKHSEDVQQLMVDRAIENDWQGLHDLPVEREQPNSTRSKSLMDDLTDTSWAH